MENYKMESASQRLSKDIFKRIEKQKPESFLLHPNSNVNNLKNKLRSIVSKNKYVNSDVKKAISMYLNGIKDAVKIQYKEKANSLVEQARDKRDKMKKVMTPAERGLLVVLFAIIFHFNILTILVILAMSTLDASIRSWIRNSISGSIIERLCLSIINFIRRAVGESQINTITGKEIPKMRKLNSAVVTINKMEKTLYRLSNGKIKLPKIKPNPKVK